MKKPIGIITRKGLGFAQGSEMISPNSFCVFFHKGHRYEPRPTIPIQPSEKKKKPI